MSILEISREKKSPVVHLKSTWVAKGRNELMKVIGSCAVQNGFTFGGAGAKMVPSPLLPDVHAFMTFMIRNRDNRANQ